MRTLSPLFILALSLLLINCRHDKDNNEDLPTSGKLVKHSECKTFESQSKQLNSSTNQSCARYSFNPATNKLIINHINAGFNCGYGSIYCTFSVVRNVIIIEEFEKVSAANCECLFDLEIEITGIEAEVYQIIFIEPYINNQQPLNFQVNLARLPEGEYCVPRNKYPWGK